MTVLDVCGNVYVRCWIFPFAYDVRLVYLHKRHGVFSDVVITTCGLGLGCLKVIGSFLNVFPNRLPFVDLKIQSTGGSGV